jgi:hypothetical protein
MKIFVFQLIDVSKVPDVAKAGDKVWGSPPAGVKVLAGYTCQGLAYPGMPSNTIMSIRVVEAESNEALSAVIYPVFVAGATVWSTPVMDLPGGAAADMEKKLRR